MTSTAVSKSVDCVFGAARNEVAPAATKHNGNIDFIVVEAKR